MNVRYDMHHVTGEDIYGRPVSGAEPTPQGKYVPPALRRAAMEEEDPSHEDVVRLRVRPHLITAFIYEIEGRGSWFRVKMTNPPSLVCNNALQKAVNGIMNRVAEGSLEPCCRELQQLYQSNSRQRLNKLLVNIILQLCVSRTQVLIS